MRVGNDAPPGGAGPRGLAVLTPVDALHLVVLLVLLLLSPAPIQTHRAGVWLPGGYLLLGAAVLALARGEARDPGNRTVRFAHFWYPVVAVVLIFWSMYYIVPAVSGGTPRDDLLIRWDRAVFGLNLVAWFRGIERPLLTDVMHLLYVLYFFLPVILVLALIRKGDQRALGETIFVLCLTFFLCYAGYGIIPAEGPRFAIYPQSQNRMEGLLLTQPIRDAINALEPSKYDVFPSAHAAVTLVVMGLALRHVRRLGWILVPVTAGIFFSLVYARYHYGVDVLAGIVWAGVALLVGPRLNGFWERRVRGAGP